MAEPLISGRKLRASLAFAPGEPDCQRCGLDRQCQTPRMGLTGKGQRGILFVAEAPGAQEDREGKQLVGDAGKYLRSELKRLGVDLDRDCWKINTINCRPPKNRTPKPEEVVACRPMVAAAIAKTQPTKIISLGSVALEGLLEHRWRYEKFGSLSNRWRSWQIPDRDLRAWFFPTFHPSYIIRSGKDPVLVNAFRRDLRAAIEHPAPAVEWGEDLEKQVRILTDPKDIKQAIRKFRQSGLLTSFDYETTGKKPYGEGHDVYTASIANAELGAAAFPIYPEVRASWRGFLISPCPKTAHNMKFEDNWSNVIFGVPVENWKLCTMEGAHVLDNRSGITSLEFQVYVRLGFMPWGMDTKRYLKSSSKDSNAFNKIREAPIRSLLLYGGLDALAQNRLALHPDFRGLYGKNS